MVKMKTMSLFGHVSRHDTLENTILQDRVEDTRKIGRPKSNSIDDVYELIGMSTQSLFDEIPL